MSLSAALGVLMVFFAFQGKEASPVRKDRKTSPFYAALENYDRLKSGDPDPAEAQKLDSLLSEMERHVPTVEAWLSILKRRRSLASSLAISPAKQNSHYTDAYYEAAKRALGYYPNSQSLAMAAAESLVLKGNSLEEGKEELAGYISLISPSQEPVFVLALHALCGNMANVRKALLIPEGDSLLALAASGTAAVLEDTSAVEDITLNTALLRILKGKVHGAIALLESLPRESLRDHTRRAMAEIVYDFGEPLAAARLLAPLEDSESLRRQADALYLAGYYREARNLWRLLADAPPAGENGENQALSGQGENSRPPDQGILYSLAATETVPALARTYLENLVRLNPDHTNAVILLSRLMDDSAARTLLNSRVRDGGHRDKALLELEIIRRSPLSGRSPLSDRSLRGGFGQLVAETWLLIDRYPRDKRPYEWGAYFFNQQRHYGETELLFRNAGFAGIESPELTLHKALHEARKGSLDRGEALLETLDTGLEDTSGDWRIRANRGLIREARRAPREALPFYEKAAAHLAVLPEKDIPWTEKEAAAAQRRDASKLQLRIARIFLSLDRPEEARRVLEYAEKLNPENLQVRLELRRQKERTGY